MLQTQFSSSLLKDQIEGSLYEVLVMIDTDSTIYHSGYMMFGDVSSYFMGLMWSCVLFR